MRPLAEKAPKYLKTAVFRGFSRFSPQCDVVEKFRDLIRNAQAKAYKRPAGQNEPAPIFRPEFTTFVNQIFRKSAKISRLAKYPANRAKFAKTSKSNPKWHVSKKIRGYQNQFFEKLSSVVFGPEVDAPFFTFWRFPARKRQISKKRHAIFWPSTLLERLTLLLRRSGGLYDV